MLSTTVVLRVPGHRDGDMPVRPGATVKPRKAFYVAARRTQFFVTNAKIAWRSEKPPVSGKRKAFPLRGTAGGRGAAIFPVIHVAGGSVPTCLVARVDLPGEGEGWESGGLQKFAKVAKKRGLCARDGSWQTGGVTTGSRESGSAVLFGARLRLSRRRLRELGVVKLSGSGKWVMGRHPEVGHGWQDFADENTLFTAKNS
jgi:hypothetical protein